MAGELRATILSTLKGDAAEKLAKQLDGVSGKMEKFGSIAGKAVKGVAALGATLVSSKFIGDSIEQAKNLERSILALDSVFGATAPRMVEFSKNAANMGLSQSEAAKASTFLGSVLQQYGFSADDAAVETEKLTKLSADLAATYGYDVQEALLAVTALFRGEYDPIEKFGVAMKQNEINAVRTARGLGDLTGAAQMQADAQIRLELLMERSTAAQGAMERGAGTLYVETEKLRATFENLQANLGQELIPVFADLFEKLRPIIEDAGPGLIVIFEFVAEVIQHLADTLIELFDPTTELGEEFMMLGNQFESLFQTIFGRDFNLEAIFDGARWALDLFIRMLHDLIRIVENVIISFQALGIFIEAVFNRDYETLKKGLGGIADELYSARDAALETANQMDVLYAKAARSLEEIGDQTEIWNITPKKLNVVPEEVEIESGPPVKDAVKEFWAGLYEEIEKQSARLRLEALGASEGLIGAILGAGQDWQKVFDTIVDGGIKAVQKAQSVFNKTAGGIKEIEEAAKQAQEQIDKLRDAEVSRSRQLASANETTASYHEAYARMIEAGFEREVAVQVAREEYAQAVAKRNAELIRQQQELTNAFTSSAREIFGAFESAGVTRQLGDYATAVEDLRGSLVELIEENIFEGQTGLFSSSVQGQLIRSVNDIADLMGVVADARDRISSQIEDAQDQLTTATGERRSLFESIVDSIMGNVNVAQIGGNANAIIRTLNKTLEQTRMFATQITQLRNLGLGESAIQQIIDAGAQVGGLTARALLRGGADAIGEVNQLYSDINDVAAEIGQGSASAMFDAGIDTMQGLVDGLLSQENEFVAAAEYLADAFKDSFDRAISTGMVSVSAPTYSDILDSINTANLIGGVSSTAGAPSFSNPTGGNITININPGLVTDPVGLGKEVVSAIQRYEQNNGRVFARA